MSEDENEVTKLPREPSCIPERAGTHTAETLMRLSKEAFLIFKLNDSTHEEIKGQHSRVH